MKRLEQIKQDYGNGQVKLIDLKWLIDTVEVQQQTIGELRSRTRFSSYMEMAEENLKMAKRIEKLEVVEKAYRAFMSAK